MYKNELKIDHSSNMKPKIFLQGESIDKIFMILGWVKMS